MDSCDRLRARYSLPTSKTFPRGSCLQRIIDCSAAIVIEVHGGTTLRWSSELCIFVQEIIPLCSVRWSDQCSVSMWSDSSSINFVHASIARLCTTSLYLIVLAILMWCQWKTKQCCIWRAIAFNGHVLLLYLHREAETLSQDGAVCRWQCIPSTDNC